MGSGKTRTYPPQVTEWVFVDLVDGLAIHVPAGIEQGVEPVLCEVESAEEEVALPENQLSPIVKHRLGLIAFMTSHYSVAHMTVS